MPTIARAALAVLLVTTLAGSASAGGSLRDAARSRHIAVGTAVAAGPLAAEPAYGATIAREYDVVVGENAFKFGPIHPERGRYDFTAADAIAKFARDHKMRLRGHTLVWYQQVPGWLKDGTFTRDEAIAILRDHINTVVGRYRGRVWAWDVVNEAIEDDGSGLRKNSSVWYKAIGPDYVDVAFRLAHEADPKALLYYNDYDAEDGGAKADAVYELVRGLKARGVPIDGVGWQMHVKAGYRMTDAHRANAARLAALGLRLMVTELDVRIDVPATPEKLADQARTYADVFAFCLADGHFDAVLTWGFTDRHSWVPGWHKGEGAALPFDESYRPKPAYAAILDALQRGDRSPER